MLPRRVIFPPSMYQYANFTEKSVSELSPSLLVSDNTPPLLTLLSLPVPFRPRLSSPFRHATLTFLPPMDVSVEGKAGSTEVKPVLHGTDDYAWLGAGTSGKMTESGSEKPGKAAKP